ncbi:MAG: hypothetical protein QM571_06960 [Micrococcaceae bacterium]
MGNLPIPPMTIVLIAVTIIFILKEQELKRSFKGVEIILLVGVVSLWQHSRNLSFTDEVIVYLIISVFTGLIFGAMRSLTVKVYYSKSRDKWFVRGTVWSAVVFLTGFIINNLIRLTFEKLYHDEVAVVAASSALHVAVTLASVKLSFLYKKDHEKNPIIVD